MVHKKVLIVLISLTVTLTLIFQIKQYFFPNYDYYVLSKLKETEQEFLKKFYSEGYVSKGKLFDIKYEYFHSVDDYKIIAVKKVNKYNQIFKNGSLCYTSKW